MFAAEPPFAAQRGAFELLICRRRNAARASDGECSRQRPATPAAATAKALQRYSLTVRGGVSLGAYEGGINWALLRVLEGDPSASLTTVTGASAGNINAFLSAVEWCQSPARSAAESPRDNLFWKAWIPVGIHGLFPRGQPKGMRPATVCSRAGRSPRPRRRSGRRSTTGRGFRPAVR